MTDDKTRSKDLAGKVALVTGSSTGLGLAIAKELGARGASVALNYAHRTDRAERALVQFNQTGATGALFRADVTEAESVNQLVDRVKSRFGSIDILVPNATLDQPILPIEEYTWAHYEEMIRFFIKSPFLLTKAVLADMKAKQWGRIVNITSEVVELAVPNFSAYVSAKGAQKAWSRSMARELAPFGITVNVVSPGWIPTERHAGCPESDLKTYLEANPVPRWGTPEDVAHAVADFCSSRSSFITGQTVCVNGGRSIS